MSSLLGEVHYHSATQHLKVHAVVKVEVQFSIHYASLLAAYRLPVGVLDYR